MTTDDSTDDGDHDSSDRAPTGFDGAPTGTAVAGDPFGAVLVGSTDRRTGNRKRDDRSTGSERAVTRRRVLAVAGSTAAALAGCTGSESTGTDSSATGTPGATTTATATPSETGTGTPRPAAPADRARTFLDRLDAGAYERAAAMLGGRLATSLDASALEAYWRSLTAQHGAFESTTVRGTETADSGTIVRLSVECARGTAPVAFRVVDDGTIVGLKWTATYSPPTYADESAFAERSVEVGDTKPLPGTLSVPTGDGPHPGVVLVHGTGAHDRDETIGPNKPLKDLAWGLASRGIAVLRYDKRTEEYDVRPANRTLDAVTVDDAVAAARRLQDAPAIHSGSVFVVGHSQGATAAPRIASKHGRLAGIAMLAGNARSITDVIVAQNRRLLKNRDGTLSAKDRSRLDRVQAVMRKVEREAYPPGQRIGKLSAALLYSFLDYDQVTTATSLSAPIFVGQGGRDYQVAPKNYELWLGALPDDRTRGERYPRLNHLFQPGVGPSLALEYAAFFDNVSKAVVADLAEWVAATAGR